MLNDRVYPLAIKISFSSFFHSSRISKSGKIELMQELGKAIISIGVLLIVIGTILSFFGKLPFLGKLPGDILIKRENFSFYALVTTGILISVVLSIFITIFFNIKK